jgi:hypothetical protein
MQYEFPSHAKALLIFRGPDRVQQFESSHHPNAW